VDATPHIDPASVPCRCGVDRLYIELVSKTYSSEEAAYREVKELILTNEFPGASLISEGDVAVRMGFSRTPVRAAFRRLEAEGWLKIYPKRGALVVPIAEGESGHVIDARLLVEAHAVSSIAERPSDLLKLVTSLRENVAEQRSIAASGDLLRFEVADAEFHQSIVRAGRNPLLLSFYVSLRERQRRMTVSILSRDPEQITRIVDDHAELVDFIAAADTAGFLNSARKHIYDLHGIPYSHSDR
jgi:DNA-binding GntR family transcriptional regulator